MISCLLGKRDSRPTCEKYPPNTHQANLAEDISQWISVAQKHANRDGNSSCLCLFYPHSSSRCLLCQKYVSHSVLCMCISNCLFFFWRLEINLWDCKYVRIILTKNACLLPTGHISLQWKNSKRNLPVLKKMHYC